MHESSTDLITLNPGPSQLTRKIIKDIAEIAESGFLSVSHRSAAFMEKSRQAIEGLREKMVLPPDYHVFYQSSATEAMDTLLRNLVYKKCYHFVCGSFSATFFKTAIGIGLEAVSNNSPWDQAILWEEAEINSEIELIAVTHNETSTGLMWPKKKIHALRERYPEVLLAVDVTSSFGAMQMNWRDADVWFGSVQKCLGLPSGLGFLIVSPRAFEKAKQVINKKKGIAPYQSFDVLADKMQQYQTPQTPNMLNIALLAQQMQDWNLPLIEYETEQKAEFLYNSQLPWNSFVEPQEWRSLTTLNFLVDEPQKWHHFAKEVGIVLGKGYGPLKDSTIRIANFPAITLQQMNTTINQLSKISALGYK